MKSIFLIVILISTFFYVGIQSKESADFQKALSEKLDHLIEKHEGLVYLAFFDLSEIRPYSILQNDDTVDLYGEEWVASTDYLETLNEEQITLLKESLIDFISTERNPFDIITKIDSWCVTRKQFDLIIYDFEINEDKLLKVLVDNNLSDSSMNIPLAFHQASNRFASLNRNEQLKLHSKIMNSLSIMAVK